jgi:hypothetical protein
MAFRKAAPQQARLKVSIYGPPGSGKTFTTLLFAEGLAAARGKRVAYVDTERGTDFYALPVPDRTVHPASFDFDAIYTRSLAEVIREVDNLDLATYGVVVIDSVTHLWEAAQEAYTGKRTSRDSIPFSAWAAIKRPYKALIAKLMAIPADVFILGRQKNLFENDGDEIRKVGVGMKAESDTPYEPHICLRMEADRTGHYCMHAEKDRSGVLAGKVVVDPNYQTIAPLLGILGDVQAASEDEDERIAADSELLTDQDAKIRAKADKSRDFLSRFQGAALAAKSVEDLGALAAEVKKAKRYMLDEHVAALTEVYKARRDSIVGAAAPEVN